jgi:hypothetical protein
VKLVLLGEGWSELVRGVDLREPTVTLCKTITVDESLATHEMSIPDIAGLHVHSYPMFSGFDVSIHFHSWLSFSKLLLLWSASYSTLLHNPLLKIPLLLADSSIVSQILQYNTCLAPPRAENQQSDRRRRLLCQSLAQNFTH